MEYKSFFVRSITNMHVGSGDNNYGVVDNMVQRDSITQLPTINSSSLKGALREHFKENNKLVNYVFGSDTSAKENNRGMYRFFHSTLFSIPVRSNVKPYFMGLTKENIKGYLSFNKDFHITTDKQIVLEKLLEIDTPKEGEVFVTKGESANNSAFIEGLKVIEKDFQDELFENLSVALFNEKDFKDVAINLPVIARNNLENGVSKNLWYEEVVPRETVFYTVIGFADEFESEFEKTLINDNIQIGANASIGYGVTKFLKNGVKNG